MPCRIPAHIFDLDEATAERLTRLAIRKRTARAVSVLFLGVSAIAVLAAVL